MGNSRRLTGDRGRTSSRLPLRSALRYARHMLTITFPVHLYISPNTQCISHSGWSTKPRKKSSGETTWSSPWRPTSRGRCCSWSWYVRSGIRGGAAADRGCAGSSKLVSHIMLDAPGSSRRAPCGSLYSSPTVTQPSRPTQPGITSANSPAVGNQPSAPSSPTTSASPSSTATRSTPSPTSRR